MRKWREHAAVVALLWVAYWFGARAPAAETPILRAEPRLKQLPRVRSAPPQGQLGGSSPATTTAARESEPEPESVWLRVESREGEPLDEVSVTLRKVGDALREPVDLDSSVTNAEGLAAISIEPFANLAPEEEAELLIEVSDYTSKLVPEAELMTALGRREPYVVVLDGTQSITLATRCAVDSEADLYLGWYTDDGVELQRFWSSYCVDGWFEVEDISVPLAPLHFVAFLADPDAPRLGLRSYHAVSSPTPPRIEVPLAPYALEFRSVQLIDTRGAGVSDTLVEPALHASPGALLDRWLNYEVLNTDLEGRFGWVSARGRSSLLSVTPPGFGERRTLELRAGRDRVQLDGVSMVRCHFLGQGGEPLSFGGYEVSAESRGGELSGWVASAGDAAYDGQANFAWPEDALSVTVQAQGFAPAALSSPHTPCVLNATAEYGDGRRPRILR